MSDLCKCCKGSGRGDVLDVWSMQRAVIENGGNFPNYDSVNAMPFLVGAIACPLCHPDASDDDMRALMERLGEPYAPETYRETEQ